MDISKMGCIMYVLNYTVFCSTLCFFFTLLTTHTSTYTFIDKVLFHHSDRKTAVYTFVDDTPFYLNPFAVSYRSQAWFCREQ